MYRLLPAYAFIIALAYFVIPVLGEGPIWTMYSDNIEGCGEYWWTNILFINNIYPASKVLSQQCMPWTWYLSLDMQFFICVPILMAIVMTNKKVGMAFISVANIGLIVVNALMINSRIEEGINPAVDEDYFYNTYIKPWNRAVPYFMGVQVCVIYMDYVQYRRTLKNDLRSSLGVRLF